MFRAMVPPIIKSISLLNNDSDNVHQCWCWLVFHNKTSSSSIGGFLWA